MNWDKIMTAGLYSGSGKLGAMELEMQPIAVISPVSELNQKGWFSWYSSADFRVF